MTELLGAEKFQTLVKVDHMKRHPISAATRDRLQRHLRHTLGCDQIWLDPPASSRGGTTLLRIGRETMGTVDQDGSGWAATAIILEDDLPPARS